METQTVGAMWPRANTVGMLRIGKTQEERLGYCDTVREAGGHRERKTAKESRRGEGREMGGARRNGGSQVCLLQGTDSSLAPASWSPRE